MAVYGTPAIFKLHPSKKQTTAKSILLNILFFFLRIPETNEWQLSTKLNNEVWHICI